jgi:hypothetical protein
MVFKLNTAHNSNQKFEQILRTREGIESVYASGQTPEGREFVDYICGRIPPGNRGEPVTWFEIRLGGSRVLTASNSDQLNLYLAFNGWDLVK